MDQLKAAFLRALLGAILVFGLTFLTALNTDQPARGRGRPQRSPAATAAINAGIAALTYIVTRGGIEGVYDRNRDIKGRVKAGDVGAQRGTGSRERARRPGGAA